MEPNGDLSLTGPVPHIVSPTGFHSLEGDASPTHVLNRVLIVKVLSGVGRHAAGVTVGFVHEPGDNLDLLRVPRCVDHYLRTISSVRIERDLHPLRQREPYSSTLRESWAGQEGRRCASVPYVW